MESNNLKTPNQIPQPEPRFDMTNNQPESKLGPVIGSVIIIIILLVGGFFLWKTLADNRANNQENTIEEDNEIEGITEEDLDELEDNTAELEADLEAIEDDLDQIEAEVEAESEGEI